MTEDGDTGENDVGDSGKTDIGENKHSKPENEENKNADAEHPDGHASEVKAKQSEDEDVATSGPATASEALPRWASTNLPLALSCYVIATSSS